MTGTDGRTAAMTEIGKAGAAREAVALLEGAREEDYGDPVDDFSRVSQLFEVMTGVHVSPDQVPLFMLAVKLSRERHRSKRDNLVDAIGYLSCRAHVLERQAQFEGVL